MHFLQEKRGLTLTEVLIATALFAIISTTTTQLLISFVQTEKKEEVHNIIYEDMSIILQQLTYEIQNGTIDYEEYYNYYVIQGGDTAEGIDAVNVYYGINYGVYGSRFFDPGQSLRSPSVAIKNPTDLGMECSWPTDYDPAGTEECDLVYTLSSDLNVGQNPFYVTDDADLDGSNAFCEELTGNDMGKLDDNGNCDHTGETDHLFLIDNTGTRKTIIARKRIAVTPGVTTDYAVGLVRMEGLDLDQNGIVDTFRCMSEFDCYETEPGINLPRKSDLETAFDLSNTDFTEFVPISPLRSSITDMRFIISPLEDPYKAYAEPNMQSHPVVTIFLTVDLSSAAKADYPGDFTPVTVQATVAAGVIGRIDSYPPITEVKAKGGASWIDEVLDPNGTNALNTPY